MAAYREWVESETQLVTTNLIVAEMQMLLMRFRGPAEGVRFMDHPYQDATHDVFRTLRSVLPSLAALLIACQRERPSSTGGDESVAASIRQREERLRQGMVASDTAILGSLWAPEYLSTSAVGHTSNRTEALVAYGAGLVNVDTAAVRDLAVRVYGSTAVSHGMLDWAGTAAGRPFSSTVRFLHVWVSSDGSWRLVASQLTNQPGTDSAGRR